MHDVEGNVHVELEYLGKEHSAWMHELLGSEDNPDNAHRVQIMFSHVESDAIRKDSSVVDCRRSASGSG